MMGKGVGGEDKLRQRSSFDFDCPATEITLQVLAKNGAHPTQYGVTGCGKRAVYVLHDSGWVKDAN